MLIEDVKKLSPMERFLYFIRERESIRLKKEAGEPKPWTDDSILQSYRFCNVRRMDDKVSQWLLKNWYEPNFDHPDMLVACALARFINKPESLAAIGFPKRFSPTRIGKTLREIKSAGNTIINAAYMVRGNDGEDKVASILIYVGGIRRIKVDRMSMEKTWERIQEKYGWGSFMAGQVVADLRWAMAGEWSDRNTWAPLGPGSARGMNRIQERDIKFPLKQAQFSEELLTLVETASTELPESITGRMELHDWQNCLCEFDKMERTLFEGRRPKQSYRGVA